MDADVLIVGAGPAGSACAAFLARAGRRVVVIDRDAFPREKPCSEYMSPATVRVLDRLGVGRALREAGATPLHGTRVHTAGGALHGRFAPSVRDPFPETGLAVARRELDLALVRAARAAGATVLESTQLGDLTRAGDGRIVGAAIATPEGALSVRAPLTIGADGLRSRVARSLGGRRHGHPRRYAFVAHVTGVPDLHDTAEMHVGPDGYVGLNPIGGGVANVALVVPERVANDARGRLEPFFLERLATFPGVRGRVAAAGIVREVLATGPFAAWSSRVTAPGALLVGDAADFFDPFTGEGICSALRGAEMVAATAGEALDDGPARLDAALREYRWARRRAFAGKWAVERLIGYAMEWPALFDHAVRRIGRRGGMADTLVGVTGDLVPARRVLNPLFLARMVV
ncbi:MAG TPA: NAD(P)/FAD-dependent oxidoreductase [Gemmatimonadales bacterium]|nr:NAD(P)/FAD-dependent oxidoreductase [Gemmatimonadales bacterium]